MKKKISIFILLAFTAQALFSQTSTIIDSLKIAYKSAKEDTNKVIILNKLTNELCQAGNYINAEKLAVISEKLSKLTNYKNGNVRALNSLGLTNMVQGKYPEAMQYFFSALKTSEEQKYKELAAVVLANIGTLYYNKKEIDMALEYFNKSLIIYEDIKDQIGIADSYNNLGIIYANNDDEVKALEYYNKVLTIREKLSQEHQAANTLNNIGNLYWNLDSLDNALKYHFQALEMRKLNNDQPGIAMSLVNIGGIYLDMKQYKKALDYFNNGKQYALKMGIPVIAKESEMLLCNTYEKTGDYANAFQHYKYYIAYRDSLFNEENTKNIVRAEMKYEYGKREQENVLAQEKKEALHQLEIQKQGLQRKGLLAGLGLMLALSAVSYRSYRNKKKANNLLAGQNKEINIQKVIIEEKNKDILDSIKYAKRIQEAILPPDSLLNKILPDHFVLYKPKDIISGDFYWVAPLNEQEEPERQSFLVAAVDCTGHGVPGALMSIVGHNGLTRAVKENNLFKPADILNYLNHSVHETLRQTYEDSSVRDGMDIALINVNCGNLTLEFAGANNPLLIIRNGVIIEIKGDKHPIGSFMGENLKPFKNNEVQLVKGDCIYIFSDGYADQFGGEKGKKFKSTQFKELLIKLQDRSMPQQSKILNDVFEQWKGNLEQVDDVCIIGVRI